MSSIVISGISGRFPDSLDLDDFYKKLLNKQSTVTKFRTEFEDSNVSSAASLIHTISKFDQTFFSISARVANVLDPLMRVMIEPCYEAIVDAGINPKSLAGSNTAVYTSSCISDDESQGCDERMTTNSWLLAHIRCLLANRISYLFDLKGTSYSIDNSWTGGIEVLRKAVADIQSNHVDAALIGVSSVLLNPALSVLFNGLNRISLDGKTRSFDQFANGYNRSEGVVALFLQRSNDCLRSYGEVVHVDSLFYGSLERPLCNFNQNHLLEFFSNFYKKANIDPSCVEFLEADGSAIQSLDSLELEVISKIFCKNRKSDLKIGSIKSNIGHSEGSSALMSIVKALMALNTDKFAPNINFKTPNPNIPKNVKVVTEPTSLDSDLVAVTSFGLTGSVGHVLLKKHPKHEEQKRNRPYPRLVLVRSRTEKGIAAVIEKLESQPFNNDTCNLINEVFKEPVNGLFYSGYTLLPTPVKPIHGSLLTQSIKRQVWFVFAGMGSQWPGMAAELMFFPVFRAAIEECAEVYKPLGIDLKKILISNDPTLFDDIVNSFCGIAACHIGLINILRAIGIEPDGMLGHSLGENGCAYADGCFTVREACLGAYARGIASKEIKLPKKGLMVSVGLHYSEIKDLPESIDIACHNSADNTTISGPKDDVENYLEVLKKNNVFYRVVNSSFMAYHSRQVIPLAPRVLELFKKAVPNPKKRSSRWISTSIPESEWDTPLAQTSSGEYHVNNFLKTVLFTEGCEYIPENSIVIEVAPHGLMQGLLKKSVKEGCVNIPLCKRQVESPANFLLSALGQLHMHGLRPNIEALYDPAMFPVSRGVPPLSQFVFWNHEEDWDVSISTLRTNIYKEIDLLKREFRSLFNHQVSGRLVSPLSLPLTEVYDKLCEQSKPLEDHVFVCEEFTLNNLITLNSTEPLVFQTEISIGTGTFEQQSPSCFYASGKCHFLEPNAEFPKQKIEFIKNNVNCVYKVNQETIYEYFQQHNYELTTPFNTIQQVLIYENGCHAQVLFNPNLMVYWDSILKVKVFLELRDDEIPLFPRAVRNFMFSPSGIAHLKPGDLIDIYYDFDTGVISAPGVYISKLMCSSFDFEDQIQDEIKLKSVHFVPHFTSLQKNVGTKKFLHCLIQLMIDNFSMKKKEAHLTLVSLNNHFPGDIVKHIQNKLSAIAQVDVMSSDNPMTPCDLLLCSYQALSQVIHSNATFLLVSCSPGDEIDHSLNIVAQYQFKEEALMLIKNKTKPMKYSVIKPQVTPQWMKSLKTKDTPLLVWDNPHVNVQTTMKQINAIGYPVVCMFLLDKKAPKFSLEESFYIQQLSKQLKVNVYKNGEWGSYYYENVIPVPETKYPIIMPEFFGSAKYLGLNLKDNTSNANVEETKTELGHIEFSGMIEGGGKIMGLAQYDSDTCTIVPDPDLTWNVPPEWNLQDAVTIPFAYTTVYHALMSKIDSKLPRKHKTILIHAGHTILGQAAITFSLSKGLSVYTTVPDVAQYSPLLLKQFPKLQKSQILSLENSDFEIELLMATKGEGTPFIFSSVCGEEFDATRRCLSSFGNFIQIGAADMHKNKEFGLNFFLRSIELFSVSGMDVYSLSKERKKELRVMIDKDINAGLIQPFKKKIYDHTQTHDAMRALKIDSQESKVVLSLTRSPNCDSIFTCLPNKTYLVAVNSSVRSYYWLNMVKWLLKRSARRIIICFDSTTHNDYVDNKLNKLMAQYTDCVFIYLPLTALNSKKSVVDSMNNLVYSKIHTLDAAFTVKLDEKRLQNLDLALREIAPNLPVFISVQSSAEELCDARRHLNMPSLCVQCASPKDVMKHLDTLSLECNAMSTSPLIMVQSKSLDTYITPNIFHDIFPLSVEELLQISKDISLQDNFSFTQVRTKSPGVTYSREVLPLFFISTMGSFNLQKLFDQILYPAFCSKLPLGVTSIQDHAKGLYRGMKNVQHHGPYTVIGDVFSSCVVMEMAKLLEKGGDKVTVILLEGLPDSIETSMQDIAELNSPTLDIEVLGDLVQVENNVSLSKSYDENINQILSSVEEPSKTLCRQTLESLTSRIILSAKYSQNLGAYEKLKATIVYVCFSYTPILFIYNAFEKYHNGEIIVKISEASSYLKLIEHKNTASVINEHSNFAF